MTAGWSWVDAVVLLVVLAYAVSGFRAGLIVSVSSLAGFIGGGALALWAFPHVLGSWTGWSAVPPLLQWGLLLVVLLGVATLGQWLGMAVGHRARRRLSSPSGQVLDAAAGAVVTVVTTALVLWFFAGAARLTGSPTLSALAGRSAVLAGIDRVVPVRVGTVLAGLGGVMAGHGFPQVFEGVGPEPITTVGPPDATVTSTPALQAAAASVLRIDGEAPSCSSRLEGTGWVTSPEYVVTNAHVVAGTTRVTVEGAGMRSPLDGEVVLFDPARDVAVVHVPGLSAAPLPLGGTLARGDSAAALGYPLGGPYAVEPARVRDRILARGLDIHGRGEVTREVYSLRASVQPGNSGGPLVDASGAVVGVVFARSLDDAQTGYALTLAEVADDLARGSASVDPVSTGGCAGRS